MRRRGEGRPEPARASLPRPLRRRPAVAMRCCETPVNKPCLEWSESPRVVCLVVRGSKVGIVPRRAITSSSPSPPPRSAARRASARAWRFRRGARSRSEKPGPRAGPPPPARLPGHGKGKKLRPAPAKWGHRAPTPGQLPWSKPGTRGRGASGQSSLGRLGKAGAPTPGLVSGRMTSACGRPRCSAGRRHPNPSVPGTLFLARAARGRAHSGKSWSRGPRASQPPEPAGKGTRSAPAGGCGAAPAPLAPAAPTLGPARLPLYGHGPGQNEVQLKQAQGDSWICSMFKEKQIGGGEMPTILRRPFTQDVSLKNHSSLGVILIYGKTENLR